MKRLRIVFLDRDSLPVDVDLSQSLPDHDLVLHEHTAPEQVIGRIREADAVIVNKVVLTSDMLAAASQLRFITLAATGTDNVDLAACDRLGIVVSNVRDYATHAVAEHTLALILALRRNIVAYRQSVAAGRWQAAQRFCYFDYPIRDLAGATLGIIGRGALGEAVAQLARGFDMRVQFAARRDANAPADDYTNFNRVLASSDIISLHCPLNDETRGLIGPLEFKLMERRPLLINTARGGLVDERALGAALESGQISGAGFDVVSEEPPGADHPFMALLRHPNFILTPHVAWVGTASVRVLVQEVMDNIKAFCRGTPRNVVAGLRAT